MSDEPRITYRQFCRTYALEWRQQLTRRKRRNLTKSELLKVCDQLADMVVTLTNE